MAWCTGALGGVALLAVACAPPKPALAPQPSPQTVTSAASAPVAAEPAAPCKRVGRAKRMFVGFADTMDLDDIDLVLSLGLEVQNTLNERVCGLSPEPPAGIPAASEDAFVQAARAGNDFVIDEVILEHGEAPAATAKLRTKLPQDAPPEALARSYRLSLSPGEGGYRVVRVEELPPP